MTTSNTIQTSATVIKNANRYFVEIYENDEHDNVKYLRYARSFPNARDAFICMLGCKAWSQMRLNLLPKRLTKLNKIGKRYEGDMYQFNIDERVVIGFNPAENGAYEVSDAYIEQIQALNSSFHCYN